MHTINAHHQDTRKLVATTTAFQVTYLSFGKEREKRQRLLSDFSSLLRLQQIIDLHPHSLHHELSNRIQGQQENNSKGIRRFVSCTSSNCVDASQMCYFSHTRGSRKGGPKTDSQYEVMAGVEELREDTMQRIAILSNIHVIDGH